MKKLLLLVFAFATTMAAQAQVGFGLRVGANYSDFRGDNAPENTDRIFGAHAGLTANIPVSADNFFSVQPEALFSMKGAKGTDDLRLYYVDIPVLARVNTGLLYFEAGPQLSVNVGDNVDNDAIIQPDYRRTGLGYVAGLGIGTPLGVSVGVRYNSDISKLFDEGDAEVYNDVFMLTLGYAFGSR
ncbi:porin family protein [Pontibacter fetidus]|uniref:PorT family protein n=1 Tax=Pontibacter fetidus TaxID=2700082 RepID=A0A6B2H2L2_9BACT|nr:porin family protein [Pontibacter fetidus]NDK57539.1 PorT family protein [Pontibacter fetidus]